MDISFPCSNPGCGKHVLVPGSAVGKKVRCLHCGKVQVVPGPASGAGEGLADLEALAEGPAVVRPKESWWQRRRRREEVSGRRCSRCNAEIPPEAKRCPNCQWPVASTEPAGAPAIAHRAAARRKALNLERFLSDCGLAWVYGIRSFGTCFRLILAVVGMNLLFGVVAFLIGLSGGGGREGTFAVMLLGVLANVFVAGYFLRFYVNVMISSLEGTDLPPQLPYFNILQILATGLKGLGIFLVYVLPIVTIPLLPLGWMALAYTGDGRGYDLIWACRAAVKRPGRLLFVWVMSLVYLIVGVIVACLLTALAGHALALAFAWLATRLELSPLLRFLLALPLFFLLVMFFYALVESVACAMFRCIGMLGRHSPDLLRMLPKRPDPLRTAGGLAAAVAISVVVWTVLMPPVLAGAGRAAETFLESLGVAGPEGMRRKHCAQNLRAIGQACRMYRTEHRRFPPDLAGLIHQKLAIPAMMVCPSTGHPAPEYDPGRGRLLGEVDYVYLGADYGTSCPKWLILCYEDPANHRGEGANVLFADGTVRWLSPQELSSALARTRDWQARGY